MPFKRTAAALFLLAILWIAPGAHAFDPGCPVATEERARALAERAAAFLKSKGAAVALPAFTARTHGFGAGDLYVFVFDFHGTLVASGGWPQHVGATIVAPDGAGGPYGLIRRLAASPAGRGWVRYRWYSPCTRSMQPKMTYVIRVGRYIVGVGAYTIPSV